MFPPERWRCLHAVKIKQDGRDLTDIDFIAHDLVSGAAALFQLKWQQPAVGDEKVRRSNAGNFVGDSNVWVATVSDWLVGGGQTFLAQRLGVPSDGVKSAFLVVLGRYGAHFSGHANADTRAAWTDWGHFERERVHHPAASVGEMFANLVREMDSAKSNVQPDSLMLPLPGLALVINPARQPD